MRQRGGKERDQSEKQVPTTTFYKYLACKNNDLYLYHGQKEKKRGFPNLDEFFILNQESNKKKKAFSAEPE